MRTSLKDMAKFPVRKISGQVYCYESEDVEKVSKAFEVFFPKKSIKQEKVEVTPGTRIIILRAEVKDKKARDLAKKLLSELKKSEKEQILEKVQLHLDEVGRFYLRFDKQIAFEKGKIVLTKEEDSSIRLIFSLDAYPANAEEFLKVAEKLLQA